jgi:hypothetical protein
MQVIGLFFLVAGFVPTFVGHLHLRPIQLWLVGIVGQRSRCSSPSLTGSVPYLF